MEVPVVLPKWGLTMHEATVVRWLKSEGDTITKGEALLEVAMDKANAEIPSPVTGRVARIISPPETVVPVGGVLAILVTGDPSGSTAETNQPMPLKKASDDGPGGTLSPSPARKFVAASPAARRLSKELGIDLAAITGTGADGLVTEADVKRSGMTGTAIEQTRLVSRRVEKILGARKATADAMIRSKGEIPQATLTSLVPATGIVALGKRLAGAASINDIFVGAVARVLQRHPRLNCHLVEGEIHFFDVINIGVAVAREDSIALPVVHGASELKIGELARELQRLFKVARSNELLLPDILDGTFTITNLGPQGIDMFTPIIYPPQVAILGIGRLRESPSSIDSPSEWQVYLSITFDHRALDGVPAASFLADLGKLMGDGRRLEEELC